MKVSIAIIGSLISLTSLSAFADPEWTIKQEVTRTEYDASTEDLFFVGSANWGSANCPNAPWVRIQTSLVGRKQMMALVTAAQMAGKSVTFYGNCGSSNMFNAVYVKVE